MEDLFKNKRILITAGPVWVPIDKVRVMTNIFGGALGTIIATKAYEMGAHVTLLMGPGRASLPSSNNRFVIRKFKYFDEILQLVKDEVSTSSYDVMIHSSAVSDYTPVDVSNGKIKSGKDELTIKLKPTIKIVDLIKEIDPSIFLVKFKLEVNVSQDDLIEIAYNSMIQSNADLIVANDYKTVTRNHKAFIIDREKNVEVYEEKDVIAQKLIKIIGQKVNL